MSEPFRIPLGNELFALVDEADLPLIVPHRWSAVKGPASNTFYAAARMRVEGEPKSKTVFMHRHLYGSGLDRLVDHRDGNGLNNTRRNLRVATHQQNSVNTGPKRRSPTGYKGVVEVGAGFQAKITRRAETRDLGVFESAEQAAQAYNLAALVEDRAFCRPNELRISQPMVVSPSSMDDRTREAFRMFVCDGRQLHEIEAALGWDKHMMRRKLFEFARAIQWELKRSIRKR